ncbi:FAD-dependent monooxygenase [Mycolicibacterium fluoranthenivorans]|uniref:2-polyprenyl-6-methoxyphenol hydroxylase n=1 Tax=Mycolicibacterium fluoranthenivorans TaxID=258505 RepID=A0A1G4WK35_9MYCO|nr:FAD-dependent monooxygenase [Mycolicibacterium fluoranthenivorans]SCX24419.1 2-polyprenyl-6-methoxyphenol hydroxylase [Mycolicibacterium fluoranthenivorans]
MEITKKILICGSGIAGPTCAYWLHKYGYSTVIVERAKALRDGGQNVDIKGAGQHVIEMMALSEQIEAKNTQECGQKYLDAAGKVIAVLPKGALGTLTNEFEILRGDFAQVLFESTKDHCEYRFGRFVTALEEKEDGISVTFDNGETEDFELVICAEGMNSSTRDMVMAAHTSFRYLGAYMAFFKIPRREEDDRWAYSVNGVGGTFITLRPGNEEETTVLITFLRRDHAITGDTPTMRKALLRRALEGRGSIADRINADLDTVDDFYFGPMSQVRASAWSKGRFVLLGDAAFCPTPFTGKGTALALVAAYVLAGEISRNADHSQAFAAYERLVRPYVEAAQKQLTPRRIRMMHPKSGAGIGLTHLAQRLVASQAVQRQFRPSAEKRAREVADDFVFVDYA